MASKRHLRHPFHLDSASTRSTPRRSLYKERSTERISSEDDIIHNNMTTRTRSSDAVTTANASSSSTSPRKLKQQKVWDVTPSEFSQLCANPIRKIVDNIKKPENSEKTLIPLSLGRILDLLAFFFFFFSHAHQSAGGNRARRD